MYFQKIIVFVFLFVFLSISAKAQNDVFKYQGMSDASAAVAIDENTFIVGSDETLFVPPNLKRSDNVLNVYRIGNSQPLYSVNLERSLKTADKNNEADIEGAARFGNRIYWISSHGRNSSGKIREDRYNFFATDIDKAGKVVLAGGKNVFPSYKNLMKDLIEDKRYAKYDLEKLYNSPNPPKEGGINIEGLAAAPNGHLLIGFRSPVTEGKALVAVLTNPNEVIEEGKKAKFDFPIEFDLKGLGIRDMAYWQKEKCFLIIAGAVGVTDEFYLYKWNGQVSEDGEATLQKLDIDLTGLNPEALIIYPISNKVQILSDDGAVLIQTKNGKQVENKTLPDKERTFRSMWLKD